MEKEIKTCGNPIVNFIFTFAIIRLCLVLLAGAFMDKVSLLFDCLPWIVFSFIYSARIKESKWFYDICVFDFIFMILVALLLFFIGFMKMNNGVLRVITSVAYFIFTTKYLVIMIVAIKKSKRYVKDK